MLASWEQYWKKDLFIAIHPIYLVSLNLISWVEIKCKTKLYHNIGIVPKSDRKKNIERGKIDTNNTHTSLDWYRHLNNNKNGGKRSYLYCDVYAQRMGCRFNGYDTIVSCWIRKCNEKMYFALENCLIV
jgi:hypothetical protein